MKNELERVGLWKDEWSNSGRDWFSKTVDLLRPRTRFVTDFSAWARAFFTDDFEYEIAAKDKFWKDPRLAELLGKLADGYAGLAEWNHDACEKVLRDLAEAEAVKAGLLINATRVAIVGVGVAPPLFETMLALGKDRVVARLRHALPALPTN